MFQFKTYNQNDGVWILIGTNHLEKTLTRQLGKSECGRFGDPKESLFAEVVVA